MKILHTSDWHIGKRLGRYDRSDEYREVLSQVTVVADEEEVDAVLHSGDLFDRPFPTVEAMNIGLQGLVALSRKGTRPVVVIAGNHDSPGLFEALAPFLRHQNVHLVGEIKRPEEGGVLNLDTTSGPLVVSCFPFLREARAFHAWDPAAEHYKNYADRLSAISSAYAAYAEETASGNAVTVLLAHFLVGGAKVHGHGAPRGERELHMGEAYEANADAIPSGPQYVALGHIHAPQSVPGSRVPAEYAGSLLELDFGEAGEQKRVVVVDLDVGLPAVVRSIPITGGRRLARVTGEWGDVANRDDLREAYLDLTVETVGPDPGLAERALAEFDYVVKVRAEYPRIEIETHIREGMSLDSLYSLYYEDHHGAEPSDAVAAAFREIMEEAGYAAS